MHASACAGSPVLFAHTPSSLAQLEWAAAMQGDHGTVLSPGGKTINSAGARAASCQSIARADMQQNKMQTR